MEFVVSYMSGFEPQKEFSKFSEIFFQPEKILVSVRLICEGGEQQMQGIKAPDPNAEQVFTELVDTYQTSLLRMCYLNLQDIGLAEDAVQETFIKAYRALSSFRNESNLKTWLMKIAINTCRDMQRGSWWKHINRAVTLDQLNSAIHPVSDDMISLNMEVAKLPMKLREVVLLYYYQDMTTEEIADALGIAPSTVSSRLKKAREKLRLAMKGVYFDE